MAATLLVAAGGAIGSVLRFWLAELLAAQAPLRFPWATLIANVGGSLLIGVIAAASERLSLGPELRLFLMVGLCGGFTTFSAFSLQTVALLEAGDWLRASVNIVASVALCLAATRLGWHLAARPG